MPQEESYEQAFVEALQAQDLAVMKWLLEQTEPSIVLEALTQVRRQHRHTDFTSHIPERREQRAQRRETGRTQRREDRTQRRRQAPGRKEEASTGELVFLILECKINEYFL